MTKAELIQYIRLNVAVGESGSDALLSLRDEQIELYLKVVITRDFHTVSIDSIPPSIVYPLVLLTKIELYFYLATLVAPEYNLSSDDGSLYRDQKYRHYKDMIEVLQKAYNQYVEDGGTGKNTIKAHDLILPQHYYTDRNYRLATEPVIEIYLERVTDTTIEVSWSYHCDTFHKLHVYLSSTRILDSYDNTPLPAYNLISTYTDPRKSKLRISNLNELTKYFITMELVDKTSVVGVNDLEIETLSGEVENIVIP